MSIGYCGTDDAIHEGGASLKAEQLAAEKAGRELLIKLVDTPEYQRNLLALVAAIEAAYASASSSWALPLWGDAQTCEAKARLWRNPLNVYSYGQDCGDDFDRTMRELMRLWERMADLHEKQEKLAATAAAVKAGETGLDQWDVWAAVKGRGSDGAPDALPVVCFGTAKKLLQVCGLQHGIF